MKKNHARYVVCAVLALALCSQAFSQVIIQHSGAADPVTEGFTLHSRNDVQLGPVTGDLGRDAWKIHSREVMEAAGYSYRFTPQDAEAAMSHGWEFSASFRFVEVAVNTAVVMEFQTETKRFRLAVSSNNTGIFNVSVDGFQTFALDADPLEYHHFRMAYDAVSEYASLWINGIERVTDIIPRNVPATAASVGFSAPGESITYSHWNEFSFAIIPEPATVAFLAGMGALLIAGGVRWRKRKERLN